MYKELTKERAEQKEIELIAKYKTNNRQYGYNIEKGGSLNKEVSQETREKLRKNMLGKKHSKETKQKMSEVRKGKNCYWYGKHLSNETKQKLSDKKKKKVNQYTIDGKFIKVPDLFTGRGSNALLFLAANFHSVKLYNTNQ